MTAFEVLARAEADPEFTMALVTRLRDIRVMGAWEKMSDMTWVRSPVNGLAGWGKKPYSVLYVVRWDAGCPYEPYLLVDGVEVALPDGVQWEFDRVTPAVAAAMEVEKVKLDERLKAQGWLLL